MPVNPVDAATAVGSTSAISAASHAQIAALQRQLATLQKELTDAEKTATTEASQRQMLQLRLQIAEVEQKIARLKIEQAQAVNEAASNNATTNVQDAQNATPAAHPTETLGNRIDQYI
jgi:chromosome segregation ATPase